MTINKSQVVLMESQVMADTDDGGGRMSGNPVVDGEVNNTFPDISRLDRVYGRVQLRKLFLAILSVNQDTFLGAHTILSRLAVDELVRTTLFQTGSHTDERIDAQDRIESYLIKATEAQFYLWGDHLEGQRSIQCLQRLNWAPPEAGEVFVLTEGANEQFFRVTEVVIERQTFVRNVNNTTEEFDLNTLQISIASTLEYDFTGSNPSPWGRSTGSALVSTTQVADAAKYYGASYLAEDGVQGENEVVIDSVYNSLVPSAQSESALSDMYPSETTPALPARNGLVTMTISGTTGVQQDSNGFWTFYLGRGIVPGTFIQESSVLGNYKDAGGVLKHTSGNDQITDSEIDYLAGIIRIKTEVSIDSTKTWTFIPGAALPSQSFGYSIPVTIQTRSLNYLVMLRPIAAPGTVFIEFRALGRWHKMQDVGGGIIKGDGVGSVNFETGLVSITLDALPDDGTEIIISWGEHLSVDIQEGTLAPVATEVKFTVTDGDPDGDPRSIIPGTLTIAWNTGGSDYTLTDDGAGNLSGDGVGTVEYYSGSVSFSPSVAPKTTDGDYTVDYEQWDGVNRVTETVVSFDGVKDIVLSQGPVKPGSFQIEGQTYRTYVEYAGVTVGQDDGQGRIMRDGIQVGTIDYVTGDVSYDMRLAYTRHYSVKSNTSA